MDLGLYLIPKLGWRHVDQTVYGPVADGPWQTLKLAARTTAYGWR